MEEGTRTRLDPGTGGPVRAGHDLARAVLPGAAAARSTAYSFGTSGVYGGIALGFNPGNYLKVFDPLYLEIRTFVIALINTLLCLALGYP